MANALYIVKLMLTARRPSHTLDMRSVNIPFWLRGNYDAMTFFGSIVTHSQAEADKYNALAPHPSTLKSPLDPKGRLLPQGTQEISNLKPQTSNLKPQYEN